MKGVLAPFCALFGLSCSIHPGERTRSASEWSAEVGAEVARHQSELTGCWRRASAVARPPESGQSRRVVRLDLFIDPLDPRGIADRWFVVTRPTDNTPFDRALTECVHGALARMPMPAGDTNVPNGTWYVTFDPSLPAHAAGAR